MVSSTAANSLNQPTPRSASHAEKFPLKTAHMSPGGEWSCPQEPQSLVNSGRTQPLLRRDSPQEPPDSIPQ